MKKTNALRVLDAHHISYESVTYDERGEFHSAEKAAQLIGAPAESVYKTLVVLRDGSAWLGERRSPLRGKALLVMIVAPRELDLRRLAKAVNEKKLRMATQREAEQLTGAQVGGISALALLNRGFEIYIDRTALELNEIHVSGGVRGLDVRVRVADLIQVTGARVVEATGEGNEANAGKETSH